jgi:Ni,Fe-hydrogenase III component G
VPYSKPQIDSICGIIPSATIYEREVIELFGFNLLNTPNTEKLILPDSWPDGVYPLRKSFTRLQDLETSKKEQSND